MVARPDAGFVQAKVFRVRHQYYLLQYRYSTKVAANAAHTTKVTIAIPIHE